MAIETTYLNERIELFDACYGPARRNQYEAVPRLYNPSIGPITSINLYPPDVLDPSMYGTSCKHSPPGGFLRNLTYKGASLDTLELPIGGKGGTMQQALLGNLGEAAERLLASLHSYAIVDRVIYATRTELLRSGRAALSPAELPLFSPEQYAQPDFPFVPFHDDQRLGWVEGRRLRSGEPILVPAQLTLFYYQEALGEPRIGYATSGGLVFHPDRRRAIMHGVYEDAERDAVNLRWYCQIPPPRVEVDLNDFLRRSASVARPRLTTPYLSPISVYLNTLDIPIPVFTAITIDRARQNQCLLAGGGAWSTRERALIQCLFEIGQMRSGYALFSKSFHHIRADTPPAQLTDFYDAPVYYGFAQNLPRVAWYMAGQPVIAWEDVVTAKARSDDEEYEEMMAWLAAAGLDPILLDFSEACWPGVSVIKVFMPQLTQAHVPSLPLLGHPRYYEVPERFGPARRRLSYAELLTDPLPFP